MLFGALRPGFVVPACIGHILILAVALLSCMRPSGAPWAWTRANISKEPSSACCSSAYCWQSSGQTGVKPTQISSPRSRRPSTRQALQFVRIAAASILIIPLGGLQDPAGLNDLGHTSLHWLPLGIPWSGGRCSFRLPRPCLDRPAPGCPRLLGHMLVLCTGIWLFHLPHWFVIGPDNVIDRKEGIEYSTLLIAASPASCSLLAPARPFSIRS